MNEIKKGWVEVKCNNLYGDGNAVEKILKVIKTTNIPINPKKEFYN